MTKKIFKYAEILIFFHRFKNRAISLTFPNFFLRLTHPNVRHTVRKLFYYLQLCHTKILHKMQPWFTKIVFLWQVRKNALNYPQKTLFVLHGSFEKIFERRVLRVFFYRIWAAKSESGEKKKPSMHSRVGQFVRTKKSDQGG